MAKSKNINGHPFISYKRKKRSEEDLLNLSQEFYNWMDERRTVREFSDKPIPKKVIENIILAASTAPSGAHKQPWTFCVVANPELKKKIRLAAEKEEKESYDNRMSKEWLEDLEALQTDWKKPFIEIAPYLIIVFKKVYDIDIEGSKKTNYYVNESVGLACGFLLTAIHKAGLVSLTHTPSPMNFLTKLLERPDNERPYVLIPVGYPAEETYIPALTRKSLEEIMVYYP